MASPYILNNIDLQYTGLAGQDYTFYLAFLNPVAITTTWNDLSTDAQGNWQPPPNIDTCALKQQPYAPTANLGPNRIGFVNEPLYFDGTRSTQRFDLPVVSYSWQVSGLNTQTLYHNGSQLSVVWPTPGLYTISLTVVDRSGNSTKGTRQVMIYQDRQSALPGVISISGLAGSLANAGWQCQITTVSSQVTLYPPDQLAPGNYQPVVILCETAYEVMPDTWSNVTLGPHGNFSPGYPYQDPRILFDGYVQNGTIHQDVDKDTLSFVCQGPQMILGEAKTHQGGYYNTWYSHTYNGVGLALKNSTVGQGFLVATLMTADVIHSLLQTHCTIGQYHDIHIWNSNIPASVYQPGSGNNAIYNLVYSTLSVNEGTILQNIQDLTSNEWSQVHCEHDGSIRVGPQANYRGSDYWQQPTLLGPANATAFINFVQDLGYTVGPSLNQMGQNLPQLPAQPMPVQFVHPWGHQPNPPSVLSSFLGADPQVLLRQQQLNGPPLLCIFSDVPNSDPDVNPPGNGLLFPWVLANWPQDLSVYPISFDFPENYTGKASLVKLIGTLYGQTSLWSSWWPQWAFSVAPTSSGQASWVASILPAGDWIVDQTHVLPDASSSQNQQLMNNWWWEMARRVYYAHNVNYNGTIILGMFTACSLGDIVGVTRQNNTLGPHWTGKPFYVTDISYNIDLSQRTWQTVLSVTEVTSILMGPITNPPNNLPKGYI